MTHDLMTCMSHANSTTFAHITLAKRCDIGGKTPGGFTANGQWQ